MIAPAYTLWPLGVVLGLVILGRVYSSKRSLCLALAVCCLAWACGYLVGLAHYRYQRDLRMLSLKIQKESELRLQGDVQQMIADKDAWRLQVSVQSLILRKRAQVYSWPQALVLVNIPQSQLPSLALGDRLTLTGKPRKWNENSQDYVAYLLSQSVVAEVVHIKHLEFQAQGQQVVRNKVLHARQWAADALQQYAPQLGQESVSILQAWLLGLRQGLPRPLKQSFRDSGTYHMFAVSGLHVMILVGIALFVLNMLRCPLSLIVVVMIALLSFLALLTGGSPSVIRATVMAGFYLVSRAWGRPLRLDTLFWLALWLIVALDPGQLFQLGFQMSFVAIGAIVVSLRLLALWPRKTWPSLLRTFCDTCGVMLALMLAMAPVTASVFGQVVWISPLSNGVAIPLMTLGMCGGLGLLVWHSLGWMPVITMAWGPALHAVMVSLLAWVELWAHCPLWQWSGFHEHLYLYYVVGLFWVASVRITFVERRS